MGAPGLIAMAGGMKMGGQALDTSAQLQAIKAQRNYIGQEAGFEARQIKRRTATVLGEEQKIAAASGVSTTSGSPLLAELDTARQGELQRKQVLSKAEYADALLKKQRTYTILGSLFRFGQTAGETAYGMKGG